MSADRKTVLFQKHIEAKAKMVPFGGWEMPIQYEGIIAETEQCRKSVALFDTCHMGEFRFKGDIKTSGIEKAVSFHIEKVPLGRCKYGFLMNDKGGVVDDLIVYRTAEDELMIVVNAATCENDFNYMSSFLKDCEFENQSDKTAKIDVQGPLSKDVMSGFFNADFNDMKYFSFIRADYKGKEILISRTGYTGELGYEIYCDVSIAGEIWNMLLTDDRVKPAGLGARDILRLEVGLSLYGHELTEDITPVEAGLPFFISFDKDFIGSDVLLKQKAEGTKRIKIAFAAGSRRSPRSGFEIFAGGKLIGEVTSGVFSPMLKSGIGLGLVDAEFSEIGTEIKIVSGKAQIDAKVCELPFYKDGTARK